MADLYAVVDKTKKIKKCSLPAERNAEYPEAYSNIALYAMVEKCNFDSEPDNQQQSSTQQATVNNESPSSIPVDPASTTFVSEKSNGQNAKSKPSGIVWCLIVLTIAVILLALISLACIVALFNEMRQLESATSRPQQGMTSFVSPIINTSLSQLAGQLSLINASLLQFQEVVSNGSQEQLTIIKNATETLNNETFSVLNKSFAMLEGRIKHLENQTEQLENQAEHFENQTEQLENQLENRINLLASETEVLEARTEQLERTLGRVVHFVSSCAALPPSSPSGYYRIMAFNGSAVRVYCDMTRSCGNITGGWMRVAELDMTNSSHQCPSGLSLQQTISNNIRTCVRDTDQGDCSAVQYSTSHIQYSRVCGKVIAYSTGSVDAFGHRTGVKDINSYVDGVSITHGNPREHIWTFAAASHHIYMSSCKCISSNAPDPPDFVGMAYFCDTATPSHNRDERLWDGNGCMSSNNCCAFNDPPWFFRELPLPTTDAIELRVCRDEPSSNEDIQIEVIELFVQ